MTGYFTRLARQSGLVPAAARPGAATVAGDAPATGPVGLHEERESPPVAAPAPDSAHHHDASAGEPGATSPPQRVVPVRETSDVAAPAGTRGPPGTAHAQPEAPGWQQPAAARPVSSSSLQTPQSAQALHLEAVQQVVEWIAAAPQSSPPERHDVQETLPASAATQEPADPLVQAAVRPVAVPTAPVVDESPDRSAAPSERLAPPERAVVQAPAERAAEPARAAHWPPPAEEEPSGESVSLSIGSIHVTVEAPAQPAARAPAPAPHTAAPAPAPSRLVRHYLRPD